MTADISGILTLATLFPSSLRKSANPNMQDEQGYTLLHHATLNGQQLVMRS